MTNTSFDLMLMTFHLLGLFNVLNRLLSCQLSTSTAIINIQLERHVRTCFLRQCS